VDVGVVTLPVALADAVPVVPMIDESYGSIVPGGPQNRPNRCRWRGSAARASSALEAQVGSPQKPAVDLFEIPKKWDQMSEDEQDTWAQKVIETMEKKQRKQKQRKQKKQKEG
jgi:hypothetical protein